MINERKMTTILVCSLMAAMVGILVYAYRKKDLIAEDNDFTTEENNYAAIAESVQDKFLSALNDTETRMAKAGKKLSTTEHNGDTGLFL